MRTIYYDQVRRRDLESSHGIEFVSMDELLAQSDVLSIHTPLNDQTRGLINDDALQKMKKTAILVNTARGPIVDEKALGLALNENRLAGASLDVLYQEPPLPTSPFFKLGENLPRVVLTPHCAVSGHTIQLMGLAAAEEVIRVLSGEKPRYPVNSLR
jgi:phosphoglycerate dehydrogenase-like enzyme